MYRERSRGRGWMLLAVAVAVAVAIVGCSSPDRQTAAPPTPTTEVPHRDPTAAEPLRVIMSGDSVMVDNLAHAFTFALNEGGESMATQVWVLAISRDVSAQVELERIIRDQEPDLVIVSMGVWELDAVEARMHEAAWRERYVRDVLAPFVDGVTAGGAEVLWIGIPRWNNAPEQADDLATLQDVYREFAAGDDRVSFLDGADYVDTPSGAFTYELPGPNGQPVQVRNPDGLHYCPEGVIRAVTPALAWIRQRWRVNVAAGWKSASWDIGPDGAIRESFLNCPNLAESGRR